MRDSQLLYLNETYSQLHELAHGHRPRGFTEHPITIAGLKNGIDELLGRIPLQRYIDWLNRPEEGLIKGELMSADDWAQEGITTSLQLAEYLDACVERELQKELCY